MCIPVMATEQIFHSWKKPLFAKKQQNYTKKEVILTVICTQHLYVLQTFFHLQQTTIYSKPPSTANHHLQQTTIYSKSPSTANHHRQQTTIYSKPPSKSNHHLQQTTIDSKPPSTANHHRQHTTIALPLHNQFFVKLISFLEFNKY